MVVKKHKQTARKSTGGRSDRVPLIPSDRVLRSASKSPSIQPTPSPPPVLAPPTANTTTDTTDDSDTNVIMMDVMAPPTTNANGIVMTEGYTGLDHVSLAL